MQIINANKDPNQSIPIHYNIYTIRTFCAVINVKSLSDSIVYVIMLIPTYKFNFIVVFNFHPSASADPMTAVPI